MQLERVKLKSKPGVYCSGKRKTWLLNAVFIDVIFYYRLA